MLGGGIDLSVGSIFALVGFCRGLRLLHLRPAGLGRRSPRRLATGLAFGAINGYLVGYLRLRAFLTTLVTFIIGRALFDILVINYAAQIQLSDATSDVWDFIGDGTVFGLSVSVIAGHRHRHHHPCRPHPLAARLARARGRRLAALGAQCRHQGAPHRVHDLCHLRPLLRRSPAS